MIYKKNYTTVMSRKIPEGQSGKFSIVKTVISRGTVIHTYTPAGFVYYDMYKTDFPIVKLVEESGGTWMSDTAMEQEAMMIASITARGDVLILGLGIGLLPTLVKMRNRMVKTITIVEKEQDVVNLVYDYIKFRKTRLIVCDADEYLSSTSDKYDFIFVDIWAGFTTPLREAEYWVTKASKCLNEKGTVRYWMQELHERVKNKLPTDAIASPGGTSIYDPCLVCGKTLRHDYAGLCMDCADILEVSELYVRGNSE